MIITSLQIFRATIRKPDAEFKGRTIQLRWFGLLLEFTFARVRP